MKEEGVSALFTDFYELTMAQGFFKTGKKRRAVFDVFFRRHPFNGGYSVFAGVAPLLNSIVNFRFSEEDIEFLREQKIFEEDFLAYLKSFKFSGDVYSMWEGEVIFPGETLFRVHAPLIEAQILEGLILNTLNFQSLIATKTCRVVEASKNGAIMEFGLRRAQGMDGAMSASRAAFVGGAASTSNTKAAKKYNLPVSGTMAHSWVMSFPSEKEAFFAYAKQYPDRSVFLIDTYSTLNSGIKNAIIVGKALKARGYNFGVRLDSGDILYLSRQVRRELDCAGLKDATISVSNELDEEIISALVHSKAPIDGWGVGTNMVTGGNDSSFTGVYKLCAVENVHGEWNPMMKFSDNPTKTTNPAVKDVYRLYDKDGMARADVLTLSEELLMENVSYSYFHPSLDFRRFNFAAPHVRRLLEKRIENGLLLADEKDDGDYIKKCNAFLKNELKAFDASYRRLLNPHTYKVSLSERLRNLKALFIKNNI